MKRTSLTPESRSRDSFPREVSTERDYSLSACVFEGGRGQLLRTGDRGTLCFLPRHIRKPGNVAESALPTVRESVDDH